MSSHCTPRDRDLKEGSTQRSVAINTGMLAIKVINIVKKNDAMKMGSRAPQDILHSPASPSIGSIIIRSNPLEVSAILLEAVDPDPNKGELICIKVGVGNAHVQLMYIPVLPFLAVHPAQQGL